MDLRRDRPGLSLAIMAAALALLPVLAVLQYRWIGQLSQAERERMQTNLRTITTRFGQDFDAELAHVYMVLLPGAVFSANREPGEYAERFLRWSATSPYRNLVRNFYLAQEGAGGALEILAFNHSSGRFDPIEWPPQFAALRSRLYSGPRNDFRPGIPPFGGAVAEEIPALIAPRFRISPEHNRPWPDGPAWRLREITGWTIAELNLDFIEKELLPELIQRHFAGADALDYQLQIVSKTNPEKVIYRSDVKLSPGSFSSADATVGLLEVRPELVGRRVGPGGLPGMLSLPPGKGFLGLRAGGPPPVPGAGERGRWQLMVRHRSGSLEKAVSHARHRNLAMSFAVLLLMAASMVMLVLSTRRAQRLAQLQMEFVAGVSHELRTPLTVICSAAENLADGLVANAQQVQRYGTVMRSEGRRLAEMVEQILAFAGAQAGRIKYDLQPVEIPAIIDRALAACGSAFHESGCKMEKRLEPDLPPVMADPTALTHCLRNLLSNALQYGSDGNWIGVRAEMKTGEAGAEMQISVADKGSGIEPAELPHIFEPFYRGKKVIAAQIHGTGLGLTLAKRIVDAHGGRITVTSAPGQGTRFTLHLPVAARPVEHATTQLEPT